MNIHNKHKITIKILLCAAFLCILSTGWAQTLFYVDPDVAAAGNGSEASPWRSLDAAAWAAINNQLTDSDVMVYFSAREADVRAHQTTVDNIQLNRTNPSAHRLTLDGQSKYNANDTTPVWRDNHGFEQYEITHRSPITTNNGATFDRRDYITVRGFRCIATTNQPIFLKAFSHGIVEDCYMTSAPGTTIGPGLILTLDSTSVAAITASLSEHVLIKQNRIIDCYGEGIYISGPKLDVVAHGLGHADIVIEGNTLINPGFRGGQGDAIDVKNYVFNCVVRGNVIMGGEIGITSHSAITIEGNAIYRNDGNGNKSAIRVNNGGTSGYAYADSPALTGAYIRNNIVVDASGSGIDVRSNGDSNAYHLRDVFVENNTIYAAGNQGISVTEAVSNVVVRNNIVHSSAFQEFLAEPGCVSYHNHNLYWDPAGGAIARIAGQNYSATTITTIEPNAIFADPLLNAVEAPFAASNFAPVAGSPAISAGEVIEALRVDFTGAPRDGDNWVLGALLPVQQQGPITEYYVDADRTSNGDGSASNPWNGWGRINWSAISTQLASKDVKIYFCSRSVQASGSSFVAGSSGTPNGTLSLIGNALYNEQIEGAAVWQPEWEGHRATLTNFNGNGGDFKINPNHQYIQFIGFHVLEPTWGGVNLGSGNPTLNINHITIAECYIDSPKYNHGIWFGFAEEGCHDILIKDNIVTNTALESIYMGHWDYLPKTITDIVVEGNTVYNCGLAHEGEIDIKPGCQGAIIRNNLVYRDTSVGSSCGVVIAADACEVYGNVFYGNSRKEDQPDWGFGIYLQADGDGVSGQAINSCLIYNNFIFINDASGIKITANKTEDLLGVEIYNNTIIDNGGHGLQISCSPPQRIELAKLINNVIANNGAASHEWYTAGDVTLINADHNVLHHTAKTDLWSQSNINTWADWQAQGHDANGHNVDPQMSITAANELSVDPSSIVIDNGVALTTQFTTDIDGNPRGSNWDIGAYETMPPPVGTTYYVRTDGNDSNDGLSNSPTGAFRTMQKGFDEATEPGDVVRVQGGTYNEAVFRSTKGDGSEANPITFIAENGTVTCRQIYIKNDDWCVIDGFEVSEPAPDWSTSRWSADKAAIFLQGSNYSTIQNCRIYDTPHKAIAGSSNSTPGWRCAGVKVLNNVIERCRKGITVCGTADANSGWLIEGNTIRHLQWGRLGNGGGPNDIDCFNLMGGNGHIIRGNVTYGQTPETSYPDRYGTVTSVAGNTFTDITQNWPVNYAPLVGDKIKNKTTGQETKIVSNTANTITTEPITGGWSSGDRWVVDTPHMDFIQVPRGVNGPIPMTGVLVENNIVQDWMTGIEFDNTNSDDSFGEYGGWTIRGNIFANGLRSEWTESPNGNSSFSMSAATGTMLIHNNTIYNFRYRPVFASCNDIVMRDNIIYNCGDGIYPFTPRWGPMTTGTLDNNFYDDPPWPADANAIVGNPLFLNPTNILGPDNLPFTADDGLQLQAGSPAIGAATNGGNVGAYASVTTGPDTIPPIITAPSDVIADQTDTLTLVDLGTPTVSDAVDPNPTVTNNAPAAGFPVGTTVVTWTATDASGNSASATQLVTINPTIPAAGVWAEAADAEITLPFAAAGGAVWQTTATPTLTDNSNGRLTQRFQVDEPGVYILIMDVDCPNGGANSLFFNINAEPTDPASIWDMPITNGIERHQGAWRGENGTFDAAEFMPKYFTLDAGIHEVIIRGREANTRIYGLALVHAEPQNYSDYQFNYNIGLPSHDDDQDQLPNLLEYYIGLNPTVSDAMDNVLWMVADGPTVSFNFMSPVGGRADLVVEIQKSTDMTNWTTIATRTGNDPWPNNVGLMITPIDANMEQIQVAEPINNNTRCFYRLRLTQE